MAVERRFYRGQRERAGFDALELLERLELLLPPVAAGPSAPGPDFELHAGMAIFREQLQRLLPLARLGVWLADEDGLDFSLVQYWPPEFQQEAAQQVLERHVDSGAFALALRQNRPLVEAPGAGGGGIELLHALSTRERVIGMLICQLQDGAPEPDAITLRLFSLVVVNATHLLKIRLLNRRIHEQNATLEQEVQRRTAEAEAARDQAELANRTKTMFLSGMSHELRTPLTAVIGYAEHIQQRLAEGRDTAGALIDVREHADVILRSARHLLGLISDILDVTKIESGRIAIERIAFDPVDAVEEVRRTCGVLAEKAAIGFAVDYQLPLPRRVWSDPLRFRQVLLNLCSNAIKFTHHGEVRVRVEWLPAPQLLRCVVTDTGIGIPAEQLAHIAEPFRQAEASTTRRYGGAGLGLFICRRLAQMLGGQFEFSSVVGQGSEFCFTIGCGEQGSLDITSDPAELAARIAPTRYRERVLPHLAGHVLVADDWHDNRNLIGLYLDALGLTYRAVADGAQAVEAALESDYDLVLMDIQMPVMNGVEAAALLRASGFARPLIALTANVLDDERARYLAAGFDRVLGKPIERGALWQALADCLQPGIDAPATDGGARGERLSALVQEFVDGLPQRLAAMHAAVAAGDRERLLALAHDLKGAGGSFGHPALGALGRELEQAAASGSTDAIADIIQRLGAETGRIANER